MTNRGGAPDMDAPATLYRLYDTSDRLLYIGVTANQGLRWEKHRARRWWWPQVAYKRFEEFASRVDALAAEALAISAEKPLYNTRGADTPPPPPPAGQHVPARKPAPDVKPHPSPDVALIRTALHTVLSANATPLSSADIRAAMNENDAVCAAGRTCRVLRSSLRVQRLNNEQRALISEAAERALTILEIVGRGWEREWLEPVLRELGTHIAKDAR